MIRLVFSWLCRQCWRTGRHSHTVKIIFKTLMWSIGVELLSVLLVFGGHAGLSFLPYIALASHFPALYLLDHWPTVRKTLLGPVLIQGFIWLILFAGVFALQHRFQRHETD